MNDEFRQSIIERLRRGEDLPREWARDIFPPEKVEYPTLRRFATFARFKCVV